MVGFRGPAGTPSDFSREVSERELISAMPRAVQVSVSIPRDYYRDVARRRQAKGETNEQRLNLDSIEEEVLSKVERTVERLIPAGSPHEAVSVTTVDRLTEETPEAELSVSDQLNVLAWRHGGTSILILLVVCALWMLTRQSTSAKIAANVDQFGTAQQSHELEPQWPVEVPERKSPLPETPVPSLQQEIGSLVQSNPAKTATLLCQWLDEASSLS
jgi:hypothetical protein